MGLQDALRKAAGLLIEMPPRIVQENEGGSAGLSADATSPERVDVDALLAEQGLGSRARDTSQSTTNSTSRAVPEINVAKAGAKKAGESKTVEQIVRESSGPNLEDIKVDAAKAGAGGAIDCPEIYNAANLPASPFSAEQMLEMLSSLPAELPLETRRQTVKVTLGALGKTMGATPETIVSDASRKIAALAAYVEHLSKRTDEYVATGERDIAALQAQIEEKRKGLMNAREELTRTTQMCNAESDRLDDVLEFFSLDVPPSKYAAAPPNASGLNAASPNIPPDAK